MKVSIRHSFNKEFLSVVSSRTRARSVYPFVLCTIAGLAVCFVHILKKLCNWIWKKQDHLTKTTEKVVITAAELQPFSQMTEEAAQSLAEDINQEELCLSKLGFSYHVLLKIAPYLEYVDCRGEPMQNLSSQKIETFLQSCTKAKRMFVDSNTLQTLSVPKTMEELLLFTISILQNVQA